MRAAPEILVFSDLDGTLLDHKTYSWLPAASVLETLRTRGHGLVLATSKTAAEVEPIQNSIGFAGWPAIVENGCGLLIPGRTHESTNHRYQELRASLRDLPTGFLGFGDMTVKELAALTGLSQEAAQRAKMRQFSEPGVWHGNEQDFAVFLSAAEDMGLVAQRGGRFITLSHGGTKEDRVAELIADHAPGKTIVLGDAPNDINMLQLGDYGVIVANPDGTDIAAQPGEDSGRIRRTIRPGPAGWAEAVTEILDEISGAKETADYG